MAGFKRVLTIFSLVCIALAFCQEHQGGSNQNQGGTHQFYRTKRQVQQWDPEQQGAQNQGGIHQHRIIRQIQQWNPEQQGQQGAQVNQEQTEVNQVQSQPEQSQSPPDQSQDNTDQVEGSTDQSQDNTDQTQGSTDQTQDNADQTQVNENISQVNPDQSEDGQDQTSNQSSTVDNVINGRKNFTGCDPLTTPRISCMDCSSRLICKSNGLGIIIECLNPNKPNCNNGICSPIPSAGCV